MPIMPPGYFKWMRVASGGIGARTTISFGMLLGKKVLPGIFRKQLQRQAEHAEGRRVHEAVPKMKADG